MSYTFDFHYARYYCFNVKDINKTPHFTINSMLDVDFHFFHRKPTILLTIIICFSADLPMVINAFERELFNAVFQFENDLLSLQLTTGKTHIVDSILPAHNQYLC